MSCLRYLTLCGLAAALVMGGGLRTAVACEGTARLVTIHDGYMAVLAARTIDEARAARRHLRTVIADVDSAALLRRLRAEGAPVDMARLSRFLAGAAFLAERGAQGAGAAGEVPARDASAVAHARLLMHATGCLRDDSPPDRTREARVIPASGGGGGGGAKAADRAGVTPETVREVLRMSGVVGVAVVILAFLLSRTWFARVRRVRRLPRFPVRIDAVVRIGDDDDAPRPAKVLDLSSGGAKLALGGAPEARTSLVLGLDGQSIAAQVIWSNAHYIGVMFDDDLPAGEVKRLTDPHTFLRPPP